MNLEVASRGISLPDLASVREPWSRAASEVTAALDVDPTHGLSDNEVVRRLAAFGHNRLREVESRSVWSIFAAQFKNILVALLGAASVAAAVFGEWVEATAILIVLAINAFLGFVTELKAVRSMEALRKLGVAHMNVRRDGRAESVSAASLVPGDIVLLEGGDVVTADLRLIEASKLQANESTLTGESAPVGKSTGPVAADATIGDRRSMLFKGTIITRGSGIAVVVATGMATELGKISRLVEEAKDETTSLEKRLNRLGRGLVWVTFVIAVLVAISGVVAGQEVFFAIETAIALAVAAVPEGLPIIATIALARSMYRMVRHNALVKRLSAVDTLGSTSVICTDKTGTLTENRMRVARVSTVDSQRAHTRALEIGVLCNNAELHDDDDGVGDPMEVALLAAGAREGLTRSVLLSDWPERREEAFDPELKMMATIHGVEPPYRVAVKGAPEAVLAVADLPDDERRHWLAHSEHLAADGLRVLAVAERATSDLAGDIYVGLEFVGLVAMLDPPRTEVRGTITACRRAGVRVVMVTGDHPVTAAKIARATGLVDAADCEVVLGSKLENTSGLSQAEREHLLAATLFARVSPKQKLDLIALHQTAGSVVAMTGDGVNDAPALRKADIGVAMGGRGTAAAREAAAMVLKDDDFSTIVVAIAEGRTIFENIRKFVIYLLSCNISEVLVVALTALAGAPLPLLPLQILFLNLVTDVFPALALGVGEGPADIMQRPPRAANEPVITRRHWYAIIGYGVLMTASVLTGFALALRERPQAQAVTVSFLILALSQLWHVFNMRHERSGLLVNSISKNPWIWGALALCLVFLLAALYVPPLAELLSLQPPDRDMWFLIIGMSLVPLVLGQVAAIFLRVRASASLN